MDSFETAVTQYFTSDAKGKVYFQRFYSTTLLETVADEVRRTSLPTQTAAGICMDRLIANGTLVRTDGKNENDDARESREQAKKNLDAAMVQAAAAPLSRDEINYYASLSQQELSNLYYGANGEGMNAFRARYDRACAEYGFQVPPKFSGGQR
jgi:hypothetical protein